MNNNTPYTIHDLKIIKEFTDLKVWQEGHKLVVLVYEITKGFPKDETYSLTAQMRRAASSVANNIAEGFGRQTYKEKAQFYYLAQGSLTELRNQSYIARDINYLSYENKDKLFQQILITHQLLQGLLRKIKNIYQS